jgi:L-threonylcarbamoyladenylate synthase
MDPNAPAIAADVLRRGGVVLYPTDTLYALGALSLDEVAYEKIFTIKGRNSGKPVHSVVDSLERAEAFCEVTDLARTLAKTFLPGALTLLLKRRASVSEFFTAGLPTFGVRIPDHPFCLALAHTLGEPFTATSANKSGSAPAMDPDSILTQLGDLTSYIDLVIDAGTLIPSLPSTVVDATGNTPIIVREGAISAETVFAS